MKGTIILLLLCSLTTAVFSQQANFSGKYKVNKTKTNFGNAPEFILPRFISVNQGKDKTAISRVQLNQKLEELPAVIDTLSFDASVFKGKTVSGNASATKLKWLNDKSFQLDIAISKPEGATLMKIIETWKLEEDGELLFIERAVEQGSMKYTTKAYFDKVKD